MARTFTKKHYTAVASTIHSAAADLNLTLEIDVICKVVDAFVKTFKADCAEFDEVKFDRACRNI